MNKKQLEQEIEILRLALVRQVLDHRSCPSCGASGIPKDATAQDAVKALESTK